MTPRGRHLGRHLVLAAAVHLAAAAAIAGASGCGADERAASEPTSTAAAGTPSTRAHAAGDERAPEPVRSWRYVVTPDDELTRLRVRACFEGRPEALEPNDPDAGRFLAGELVGLELANERLEVERTDSNGCVEYGVDLDRVAQAEAPLTTRARGGVMAGVPLWLWGPVPRADGALGTLEVDGGRPSHLPWDRVSGKYELDPVAFVFDAPAVFGPAASPSSTVSTNGVELQLVTMEQSDALRPEVLEPWLSKSTEAVVTLFGEFPVPRATLVLLPVEGDRPVVCGHTYRGGGASIVLRVDQDATAERLVTGDWVTVHEMVHLGLPYVRREDAWLSEGLATYYQEMLRARAGMQSDEQAWERILDGFARAREGSSDTPLREATAEMHATHGFERVYWSGAAIAMLADVELRRRDLGTLDDAVRSLRECCAWPPRPNSAEHIVQRIDEAVGEPVFSEVAGRWLDSEELPAVDDTLEWLGVRVRGDRVHLLERAPGAEVRRAITAAPAD